MISRFATIVLGLCCSLAIAGGWDVGPFDNDDALDWVWELSESNDLSAVEEAMQRVSTSSGYLEAPTGSVGIAAAEVVAALNGKPRAELPAEVGEWIENHDLEVSDSLLRTARQVVERVQDAESSELAQLWSDSDELLDQWHKDLSDLALRLQ